MSKYDTHALGQLGYEYASRTNFGPAIWPAPKTFAEATAQLRRYEQELTLSLAERNRLREEDIFEAARITFGGLPSANEKMEEEEDVNNSDKNQTKWVRTVIERTIYLFLMQDNTCLHYLFFVKTTRTLRTVSIKTKFNWIRLKKTAS